MSKADINYKKVHYFSASYGKIRNGLSRIKALSWREILQRLTFETYKAIVPKPLSFPQNVHIEVTNVCNLDCIMCPYGNMPRKKGYMDYETFTEIIDQCAGRFPLQRIALMGLGEPLLHPQLIKMSRYAKQAGIRNIYTSTNCVFLDEEKSNALLKESGFDHLIFSIDGATKETYEQLRRRSDFNEVVQNVARFLELKRKLVKIKPRATLQILVMKETQAELDDFCRFWMPLLGNRDDILIKDVDTFGGQVEDRRVNSKTLTKRRPCRQLWADLSISWDGEVTVCCKDVYYKLAVGNLREENLEGLWKGKNWNKIRELHLDGRYSQLSPCDKCQEWNI